MSVRKAFSLLALGMVLTVPAFARNATGLHWETLHVYHTEPTEVFSKLGLTHSTRYGHTLGQKHVPDPTFPPGLTDVVPYDAGHTLLVRGTTEGLEQFRARVSAFDVPDPVWQLSVTLLRKDAAGGMGDLIAQQNKQVQTGVAATVHFDTDGQMPEYEITIRMNRDGSLAVTRRTSLTLAPAVSSAASPVFVPAQVWTRPITEDVRVGDMLTFDDLAADRDTARQSLDQAPDNTQGDFTVQIQITPATATTAPLSDGIGSETP